MYVWAHTRLYHTSYGACLKPPRRAGASWRRADLNLPRARATLHPQTMIMNKSTLFQANGAVSM